MSTHTTQFRRIRTAQFTAAAIAAGAGLTSAALAQGTVAWRFPLNATYAQHPGVVAADGTVYVQDVLGTLYALSPTGEVLWTYETGGLAEGPLALAADGTIYVSGNPAGGDVQIHAVDSDGMNRWTFSDPGVTQGVIAGPAVGPDGNVYAVTDFGGLGVFSVNGASGALRWSHVGNPQINERGQTGVSISFGSLVPGGAVDQLYVAFDMNGTGSATGLMFNYTLEGALRQSTPVGGDANVGQFQPAAGPADGAVYLCSLSSAQGYRLRSYRTQNLASQWTYPPDAGPPTNYLTQPSVGPDGTIYVMRNLGQVHAVRPDGSNRWTHSTTYTFNTPVADPTNSVVVVGGRVTFGQPGFVKGLAAADGQLLWSIDLPDEAGVRMVPMSPPWFSPNGRRAYITTTLPGSTSAGYLYAIDLAPVISGDVDGDGQVDLTDLAILLAAFGACDGDGAFNPSADFDADGCVELSDLATLLTNFGL